MSTIASKETACGFHFGEVVHVDALKCTVRVKLTALGGMVSHPLPILQQNTLLNQHRVLPDVGSLVAVVLSANGVDGAVLGAIYTDKNPPPTTDPNSYETHYSDGTKIRYNPKTSKLEIGAVGSIEISCQGLKINGNVSVSGNISASGSVMDTGGNSNHHIH